MLQSLSFPGLTRRPRGKDWTVRGFALGLVAGSTLCCGYGQETARTIELKPKQSQTLVISLAKGQVARVRLSLQGGLVGVRANLPEHSDRPLWLIDLGRGASVTYVVGGRGEGQYGLELSSVEQEKVARLSVEIGAPTAEDDASLLLKDAEDALANADLTRRHWKSALVGLDALKSYDRALELATELGDVPMMRLTMTQKARYLIFRLNRFEEARGLLEQAVALAPAGDEAQQALAWKTLSTVRYDLGKYELAIQAANTALDLYRKTGDVYWQGIVLGNVSSVYAEMGQGDEALAAAQEALRDAEQERDAAGVVFCLAEVANLYRQQGNLEGALRTFQAGLSWVGRIGYAPLVEAEIQKDLGLLDAQIGNWEKADQALRRCLELEEKQNDPVSLEARGVLADVMQHQGRLGEAIQEDTAAVEVARALKVKHEESTLLLKRASVEMMLKQQSEATSDIEAAEKLAFELSAVPLQIEAAIARGDANVPVDAKAAEASYRKALQLAQRTGEREQESVALAGLARSQQREGLVDEAAVSIEAALKLLESSRGSLTNRELQVNYFAMHRGWYELAVDLCMQLDSMHPAKGYALIGFDYTERARARALLDTLLATGYDASSASEGLREAYAQNQQAVAGQRAQLERSNAASDDEAAKMQDLYREQEVLETQMQSSDQRISSLLGRQTADIALLQRELLSDHEVMLSYWIGGSHSYRWTIEASGVSVKTLPARAELDRMLIPLERMLQARRSNLAAGEDITIYASRQQAYEHLLQLALSRAGSSLLSGLPKEARTVFVVTDGSLMSLPFAALRVGSPSATYAIRRYSFFVEPSASVAVYLKQHPGDDQPLRIAVFADPVFSRDDPRAAGISKMSLQNSGASVFAKMPRLNDSKEEAREIVRLAPPGTVALRNGFDATPERVRSLRGGDTSILHFATHTVTVTGHPEMSGIALSMLNDEGKVQDGVFWLKDIYALHLAASLVVLSGCSTDNMRYDTGEGLNSLSRAFFFSGVHSVVGSLWEVDDRTTSRMMGDFYRNLLQNHKRADEALRAAQLKMLNDPSTSSPSSWASFVLAGWPSSYAIRPVSPGAGYSTNTYSSKSLERN